MATIATDYETDVIAWANEQARLLRAGLFSQLDIEHIAELRNAEWWELVWGDAARIAETETSLLNLFPESCPWTFEQIMDPDFWPSSSD